MDDGCEITKKMRGGWSHVQVLFAPSGLGFGYICTNIMSSSGFSFTERTGQLL